MAERGQEVARKFSNDTDADLADTALDPSELSRLIAEFTRQQASEASTGSNSSSWVIKGMFPYMALCLAALLAGFSIYRNTIFPLPAIVLPQATIVAPAPMNIPAPSTADQASVLPDKLRQISNCQLESIHMFPHQGDVRALQVYNLCMTGAGFTPDYSCDTTVGVPAYNPQCWTPGKNM